MPTDLEEINVDAVDPAALGAWYAKLLGWRIARDSGGDVSVTPPRGEPGIELLFAEVEDAAAGSGRLHLDLRSHSWQEQRELVERAEAAGAKRADAGQGAAWVALTDPEGGLFCVLEPREDYRTSGALAAVVVQSANPASAARFWASATGWGVTASGPDLATVRRPGGDGPALEFVLVDRPPPAKNRIHLDVRPLPGGDRDAEVERLIGLGARPLDVGQGLAAPGEVSWVVLADPEGAAFCVLAAPAAG
jgi:predicted enzyme related to lactoylglutathione lyase